ncbi:MAG: AzlC family ABC transporter permease [Clostridia bacterium]|nr:AzlC family ABC transporter permease [Clostridia bacterium]MBR2288495.1 AzlC family ABC transporter permease [Clostridia bacterium]
MRSDFKKGLRDGIPIGLGYLSVSFAFGIQAMAVGLTPLQALLISLTNVTSAGQLAGIQLIGAGASLVEMGLTQLTINLRYALMSLALSQKMDGSMGTLQRMIFSFCNTDEIFAVASGQKGRVGKWYLYGLMLVPYFGWALGTYLGSVAGTLLPLFVRTALGIAIYGMFLAIIIPPSRKQKSVRTVVLVSAALSILLRFTPVLRSIPAGYAIILCALIASTVGAILFPVEDEAEGDADT